MKKYLIIICIMVLSCMAAALLSVDGKPVFEAQPVGVVELFTSEGCSSCPPAEKMFKEMLDLTAKEGKNVIGLAFHITYWNNSWEDPYSKEAFTERQKQYKEIFDLQSIYTPQMVFNGEVQFVGSNPIAFRNAVEDAWTKEAEYEINASAGLQNDILRVFYELNRKPGKKILNVAWIEHSIENHILRGENKALTLTHHNVVRHFKQTDLQDRGEVEMPVPEGSDLKNSSVVLYIQHQNSMKVLGATKIDIR